MFRRFRRTPQPQPPAVDPAAFAAGLRAFADDVEAGDSFALDCIGPRGELPHTPEGWAAYPTWMIRRVRIAYFGQPSPGEIPPAIEDQLWDRLATEPKDAAQQAAGTVTYPVVDDTDEAVAAKLRTMASETTSLHLAEAWNRVAMAAEAGQLSPAARREYARGTTFSK
ncbi:hypothetical protein [Streptomyces sp. NPDC050416]|uniref:hypothetical protein n=1 Tax=Streptomyces sp. NPDC050416 TaxID=3365611 RepID=UPI003789E3B8